MRRHSSVFEPNLNPLIDNFLVCFIFMLTIVVHAATSGGRLDAQRPVDADRDMPVVARVAVGPGAAVRVDGVAAEGGDAREALRRRGVGPAVRGRVIVLPQPGVDLGAYFRVRADLGLAGYSYAEELPSQGGDAAK